MAIRQKIVELAQHVSGRKENFDEKNPEYYIFSDMVSDEEADLLIAMKRRVEESVEDLSKRLDISYSKTFQICMHLTDLGILELKPQSDGTDRFELPIMFLVFLN